MYRILLADDEPIILSGLQSMLHWEDYDCTVAGSARNGEQALELIRQLRPDVVICDINMPLRTGLEVLNLAAEEAPEVVFIMLTNYEDFDMAREALRGHATDYLLKIDLDADKLAASVVRAVQERERRGRMKRTEEDVRAGGASPGGIIQEYVSNLLDPSSENPGLAAAGLEKRGAADRCAVAELIMDPSHIPNIAAFTKEERERLFSFHYKLVEELAQKMLFHAGHVLVPRGAEAWLYLWNLDSADLLRRFHAKLCSTLGDISQLRISFLITELVPRERLTDLRLQLAAMRNEFNVCPRSVIQYTQSMVKADYVEAAKRYVESHVLERVTVQDVAAAIGITPNYLSSLFKRQLGQNFIDYVNAMKIRHACFLLQSGQHLIYEVSHMLGYDNAYYFTKVFKKYMKVTPTEYQARAAHEGELV